MCAALHATCAEVDTGMLAACNLLIWAPIARKESAYIRVVHLGFYTCPPNVVNPLVYPNINRIRTLTSLQVHALRPPHGPGWGESCVRKLLDRCASGTPAVMSRTSTVMSRTLAIY